MGMSASQARLLSVTARLSNSELQAQQIMNSKIRLSSESESVNQQYLEALNQTKMQVSEFENGGFVNKDVTYNQMTKYDGVSTSFTLSDINGRILITEDMKLAAPIYQNQLKVDDSVAAAKKAQTQMLADKAAVDVAQSADNAAAEKLTANPKPDGFDTIEKKYQDSVKDGARVQDPYEASVSAGQTLSDKIDASNEKKPKELKDVEEFLAANQLTSITTPITDNTELETKRQTLNTALTTAKAKPEYTAWDTAHVALLAEETAWNTAHTPLKEAYLKWKDVDHPPIKIEYDNACAKNALYSSAVAAKNLTAENLLKATAKYDNAADPDNGDLGGSKQQYDSYYVQDGTQVNDDGTPKMKLRDTTGLSTAELEDVEANRGKYDPVLMQYILGGGATRTMSPEEEKLTKNPAWLEGQLKNGSLMLNRFDKQASNGKGSYVQEYWNSASFGIAEVTDDKGVNKVKAKFDADLLNLQSQEKKLDLDLRKIDTLHNALQTEYDAVKKVIEKNIDRSFKTFG